MNRISTGLKLLKSMMDTASIVEAAAKPGRMLVVAENHTVVGGLGEGVAERVYQSVKGWLD